ncbi:MAG: redoxin domain-containing protein [Methanotrichaceae archaeon]|nr:redoxin domain-containing protein [Methanotrichaceae archaeon]
MSSRIKKRCLISGSFTFLAVLASLLFLNSLVCSSQEIAAPDFKAVDLDGNNVSLSDLRGKVVLLHINSIENPLCRECENSLNGQTRELQRLKEKYPAIEIITLNIRKNSYSKDGRTLAGLWWNISVNWPWIEDYEPYPLTSKFINYSTLEGGFANPTLIFIDKNGTVAGQYHVYLLGKGEIDGIQSAESLYEDFIQINQNNRTDFENAAPSQGITYLSMFILGIITSLSPCSIALLLAMFSYVMTTYRREEYLQKNTSASKEGFMIGVAFTIGMASVFFVLGLFLSDLGVFLRQALFFDLAAGLLMIILGINILKPIGEILEPIWSRISFRKDDPDDHPSGKKSMMERAVNFSMDLFKYSTFIGAFSLGVFFALGWAPCAFSLVFPVLIWLTSQSVTSLTGGLMLFTFGVGHGILIIPIATFTRAVGVEIGQKYISAGRWVTKFFGLVVIVIGLIYVVRYFGFKLW